MGVREPADVVQHHADVRVRRAEPGDEDGMRVLIQRGGVVESARVLEHAAKVVSDPCRGEIMGRQAALGDGQRPTVGLLGAPQVAGSATESAEPAQPVDSPGGFNMGVAASGVEQQRVVVVGAPDGASAEAAGM